MIAMDTPNLFDNRHLRITEKKMRAVTMTI